MYVRTYCPRLRTRLCLDDVPSSNCPMLNVLVKVIDSNPWKCNPENVGSVDDFEVAISAPVLARCTRVMPEGPGAARRGSTAAAIGPGAVRQRARVGRPPAPPWATAAAAPVGVGTHQDTERKRNKQYKAPAKTDQPKPQKIAQSLKRAYKAPKDFVQSKNIGQK